MVEMYNSPEARRTLDEKYMTGYLRQAQWAEFTELKKIIIELVERKKSSIDILDIGIGNARIPVHLSQVEEIWKYIGGYDGIDISDFCLKLARRRIKTHNISDKINIKKIDARDLSQLIDSGQRYDLVICTYFTSGNFVPDSYSFNGNETLDDSGIKKEFQRVFKSAYDLLRPFGELVLGSVYVDNTSTEEKQKQFYEKCGMTVIDGIACFTATQEGFWSLRFTEKRIKEFFEWINPERIKLIHLDTYNFAIMVRIVKEESKSLFVW